ncbi:MAG: glycosyltransferase family 4 protein [Mucilaginibacter sp.]|nr:glycosyltransferase family 4 protein [Mucilaginibacter sp.]
MDDKLWNIVYKRNYLFLKAWYTILAYGKRYLLLFKIHKFDIVYIHLWGTPFGLPIYEWLLRKHSKKIIYDIDDLIYKGASSPNNKFMRIFKSGSKVNFLMKYADNVLVSTDKLLEYAKGLTTKISVIPATIDVNKYIDHNKKESDVVVIGWSGSHTTSKYLHLLDNVLKEISSKHNIKIMVMGDTSFYIKGLNIQLIEWTENTEVNSLMQFDIGIHPLPDEEWVYGKSGGKLVQYMAAGIPIVASAIGPNFKVIKNGYNGFLVNDEKDWIDKLDLLVTDSTLRKTMGNNSRKNAVDFYSVEANLAKYLKAFDC